jgi:hypothetical protein
MVFIGTLGCAHRVSPKPRLSVLGLLPPDQWSAGMAEIDITPPIGYRMAGYFDERFSTGVHDPLKAKALVLDQGGREVAFVFCDLIGLSLPVSRAARAQASSATGIPVTNIVMAATHSHTGPLFADVRSEDFHRSEVARHGHDRHEMIDYPAFLTRRLVEAVVQAKANLQPVELDAGIARQQGLPFNRRYRMKNGKVAFNPGLLNSNIVAPAGPVDSDVGILFVKHKNSPEPIGGLTVFAMHADSTGGTEFSADYPYGIEQSMRKVFGSNYISAFGAGTCGDLNHVDVSRKGPIKGFEVAEGLGKRIAATVLADLDNLKPVTNPAIAVRSRTLVLPLQKVTPRQVASARVIVDRLRDTNVDFYLKVKSVKAVDLSERGTNWPMEVQVFRLNRDTAIVCLPAEIFVQFGLDIKAASPFKQTLVMSICNDRPSYIPTKKAFGDGAYEVVNSRLQAGAGEAMVDAAIQMLKELKSSL